MRTTPPDSRTARAHATKVCQPLWTAAAGSSGSSPVVGGDRVYVMNGSRLLQAFDAAGGTPLWTAQVPPSAGASSSDSPAVAYGRVYAGNAVYDAGGVTNCSGDPTICAPLWRVSEGGQLPVVANGILFAGGSVPSGGGPATSAAGLRRERHDELLGGRVRSALDRRPRRRDLRRAGSRERSALRGDRRRRCALLPSRNPARLRARIGVQRRRRASPHNRCGISPLRLRVAGEQPRSRAAARRSPAGTATGGRRSPSRGGGRRVPG